MRMRRRALFNDWTHLFVSVLTVCNFIVHDRCLKGVVSPCVHIATALIEVSCSIFSSGGRCIENQRRMAAL
jgi:hypothetical protein